MSDTPSPPPPRYDIPRPAHMTEERYVAYLDYLAGSPPDSWRDTDGTIYLIWVPPDMVDPHTRIPRGDRDYARFLDDLLPQFDYQGVKVPHAAAAQHDAHGG